ENQFILIYQKWFLNMYKPSYTNAHNVIAGIVVGYLYQLHKQGRVDLQNSSLYRMVKGSIPVLILLAIVPINLFYNYEISRTSWISILHFVSYRNFSVVTVSVAFIECFLKPPGLLRKFLASKPMTCLGKLSFCFYVVHVPMLRLLANRFPLMMNPTVDFFGYFLTKSMLVCYTVALVVYFCLEQPASLLLKHWYFDRNRVAKKLK
ncbi:uncharacterized protein LOC129760482, partial [Uranotaenia lowii]|uniref:uncharacterized protein LOC129760482 n=1 Tax=Uranotaenia lowii TaxID=190385 RepID=UPI00247A9790